MHANIGSLPDGAAPIETPRERLISIPYLLLRACHRRRRGRDGL